MVKKTLIDIDILRKFEVVAYGCHERARRVLRERLAKLEIGIFNFVEYFCLEPIYHNHRTKWKNGNLYFPYIRRIVEENQFLWCFMGVTKKGPIYRLQPKTPSVVRNFAQQDKFVMRGEDAIDGKKIFRIWREYGYASEKLPEPKLTTAELSPTGATTDAGTFEKTDTWKSVRNQISSRPLASKTPLQIEYGLIGAPWEKSNLPCRRWAFPIASDAIFYGYFVLLMSAEHHLAPLTTNDLLVRQFRDLFDAIVQKIYLPVLVLFHESLLEDRKEVRSEINTLWGRWNESGNPVGFSEFSKATKTIYSFMSSEHIPFLCRANKAARHRELSDIEERLRILWEQRCALIPGKQPDKWDDTFDHLYRLRMLKDSLLFAQYNIASPGLVDEVNRVITESPKLEVPTTIGQSLPAALVYGRPGSGKDTVARMIPLFATGYFGKDLHVVNMAALRPDILIGPLLQGISLSDPEMKVSLPNLDGILVAASRPVKKESAKTLGNAATFILDELNSLNIDLQGILLRILEQGEVTPLLGLERKHVAHLVIGIVNEDPEQLTRENEIRDLLTDKEKFGTLVGGLLYEVVRRSRRLRDDLYHRLRRQLYVRLPDIDDRREDIPILFYSNLPKDWKGANVDFRAYRLLMHPSISWLGNIRQIQSVSGGAAKRAKQYLSERRIPYDAVLGALQDEFPTLKKHFEGFS